MALTGPGLQREKEMKSKVLQMCLVMAANIAGSGGVAANIAGGGPNIVNLNYLNYIVNLNSYFYYFKIIQKFSL